MISALINLYRVVLRQEVLYQNIPRESRSVVLIFIVYRDVGVAGVGFDIYSSGFEELHFSKIEPVALGIQYYTGSYD